MKKIIDTNILLEDPSFVFKDSEKPLLLTSIVLEEIDNSNHPGASEFKTLCINKIKNGEELPFAEIKSPLISPSADDLILESAQMSGGSVVTGDKMMAIKAKLRSIECKFIEPEEMGVIRDIYLDDKKISESFTPLGVEVDGFENEYVTLKSNNSNVLAVIVGGRAFSLDSDLKTYGIKPKNRSQRFALDALLNEDVKLVALTGPAGCGKTLLALAAGMECTVHKGSYEKVLISRPTVALGGEVGFLPGGIQEKMDPWVQPIYDNFKVLHPKESKNSMDYHMDSGTLSVEALCYIRGRSIIKNYFIVDEAQNMTYHELKTLITRCGEETKIILTGDTRQTDIKNSGLVSIINKMKGSSLFACVHFERSERSNLVKSAINRL